MAFDKLQGSESICISSDIVPHALVFAYRRLIKSVVDGFHNVNMMHEDTELSSNVRTTCISECNAILIATFELWTRPMTSSKADSRLVQSPALIHLKATSMMLARNIVWSRITIDL